MIPAGGGEKEQVMVAYDRNGTVTAMFLELKSSPRIMTDDGAVMAALTVGLR